MRAKHWIAATLALGVALVVWVALPRGADDSGAARLDEEPRAAERDEAALDAPGESARAAVDPKARREASASGAERTNEVSETRPAAAHARLFGVLRGLAQPELPSAVVVCEVVHAKGYSTRRCEVAPGGEFELNGLPPDGLFLLRAQRAPHGGELARSGLIELGPGERERYVELTVGAHATRLVVRVRDESGMPVARAKVRVEAVDDHEGVPSELVDLLHVERSGETGELVIAPINPTSWRIDVEHDDYATASTRAAVRAGETTEVEVVLRRGAELRGRLLTTQGDPASDEQLCFTFADPLSAHTVWMRADVDHHGHFVLAHAPEGELTPKVERYKDRETPRLLFDWIELPAVRADRGNVDLIVPELCTLVGRWVSEPRPAELRIDASWELESSSVVIPLGTAGEFSVPLEPRSGRLHLELRPHNRATGARERSRVVVDTAFPAPGETLDLGELQYVREPVLTGVVRTPAGVAGAGVRVRLEFEGPSAPYDREVTTDSDGRFEFDATPNAPGALRVRFESAGQAELRLENVAAAARSGEASLALQPPARVAGLVRWNRAAHRGPPRIALLGRSEDGERVVEARTFARDSGDFELVGWPSNYELWLHWLGDETWTRGPDVRLEFGRVSRVEWTVD